MHFANTIRLTTLIGCLAGSLLLASPASHAQNPPTTKDFQALYDQIAAATKKRDIGPIKALVGPKMTAHGMSGKTQSREE